MTPPLLVAVEGKTDEPFARAVIGAADLSVHRVVINRGHGEIDRRLKLWCSPANPRPMLVLRDFDPTFGAACPAELITTLVEGGERSAATVVRIAVRETEAWMLADRDAIRRFFQVPIDAIPTSPDDELDPKRTLVDLCRESSSEDVRTGMVPRARARRTVGPRFTGLTLEFGTRHWSAERAAVASPSLAKAIAALKALS